MLKAGYCVGIIAIIITITNCIPRTYRTVNKQKIELFVDDSIISYQTDTTYTYHFTLPANGYYELEARFYSEIAKSELYSDTSRFAKTIFYDNDTLVVQATILQGDSIIYTNMQKNFCVLNGRNLVFRYNTFRDKIPIKTGLNLRVNIIRIGCNFPYNDVKLYLYMHRANILR